MKSRRGRRNAGDTMSKVSSVGVRGANAAHSQNRPHASSSTKTPIRSAVVLEAASSAEVASYDYEAALSQPDFDRYYSIDNGKGSPAVSVSVIEKKKVPGGGRGRSAITARSPPNKLVTVRPRTGKSHSSNAATQKSEPCHGVSEEGEAEEDGSETGAESDVPLPLQKKSPSKNVTIMSAKLRKHVPILSPRSSRAKDAPQTILKARKGVKADAAKRTTIKTTSVLDYNNKNSKIPRATCVMQATNCCAASAAARVCPVAHTTPNIKSKHSVTVRPSTARSRPPNGSGETRRPASSKPSNSPKPRFKDTRIAREDVRPRSSKVSRASLRKEPTLEPEPEPEPETEMEPIPDRYPMFSSADESPAVVGSAGDPSAMSVLRNLRLNCPCRSCNDQRETVNLELSIHDVQDPWSDSRSSPEMGSGTKRWSKSMKNAAYIESSSEEVDVSSDYSSDNVRPKKRRSASEAAGPVAPFEKSAFFPNPPRIRTRRRTRFSFFNTLFDIVFWPFLFLRTNR